MNGATAELCVVTIKNPRSTRTITIGVSHHFFLTFKNPQNSLRMDSLLIYSPAVSQATALGGQRMDAPIDIKRNPATTARDKPIGTL